MTVARDGCIEMKSTSFFSISKQAMHAHSVHDLNQNNPQGVWAGW